jgi:hypothetical protein
MARKLEPDEQYNFWPEDIEFFDEKERDRDWYFWKGFAAGAIVLLVLIWGMVVVF